MYGIDVYYIPKTTGEVDEQWNEASGASYDRAILLDVQVKYPGFGGAGDLLSSLGGATIDDTMTLIVSRRTFQQEVGDNEDQSRPLEGDLIYLPLNRKIFKVTFVEHESTFYQGGALQVWELNCSLFDYSGEQFDTGIEDIDNLTEGLDQSILGHGITAEDGATSIADEESGLPILFEEYEDGFSDILDADNDYYQQRGLEIIDFTEVDPFSDGSGSW